MRPLAHLLVLASLLPLAACAPNSFPNGKRGVLFIFGIAEEFPMSRYLEHSFRVPGRVTQGDILWGYRTHTFDFSGTTMEVSGEGIELISASLDADGNYDVRFRCLTPSGEPTEVSVRVMDGTQVRYADATDVTCYEPESLETYVTAPFNDAPINSEAVTLGGQFRMYASVRGPVNGGTWTLMGSGIGFADAGPLSLVSAADTHTILGEEMILRAERLGSNPVFAVGPLQTVLPMEVVPDTAWALKVWTRYSNPNYRGLNFAGYPELADGGIAVGLRDACTFSFSNDAGIVVDAHECNGYGLDQPDGGEVCVSAFGQSACGTW